MTSQDNLEKIVNHHSEEIAVLKVMAKNTEKYMQNADEHMKDFGEKLDLLNNNYLGMQGTIKAFVDIKADIKDLFEKQEEKIDDNTEKIAKIDKKVLKLSTALVVIIAVIEFLGNYPRIIELFN